jgi:hypothetical protein
LELKLCEFQILAMISFTVQLLQEVNLLKKLFIVTGNAVLLGEIKLCIFLEQFRVLYVKSLCFVVQEVLQVCSGECLLTEVVCLCCNLEMVTQIFSTPSSIF